MNENTQTEKLDEYQSYARLVRYLRKQEEAQRNETSHTKEADSNKPE